jgi:integrase/recombinase XerC
MLATAIQVMTMWESAFERWLRKAGRADKTISAYEQDVRVFSQWFIQENGCGFEPGLVTTLDLQAFRKAQIGLVQPSTWNRRRAALRVFCRWAMQEGLLQYDPSVQVERQEEVELAPRWLDRQEYGAFMRQVERLTNGQVSEAGKRQAVRDQAMVALMVFCGLREGEVCGLDWGDMQLGERSGRVVVRNGKGGKRREVPVGAEGRRMVRAWMDLRGDADGALFTGKRGERIQARGIQRRVAEIGRLAGVEVTPHDLRHTCAKRLVDRGAQLPVVAAVLGHARLETTRRYVQPGWGDLQNAVE